MSLLDRFLHRRRPELLLVSKEVCPLCDEALELIEAARAKIPSELSIKKIDEDAELQARHALEVPVLFIDGRKTFFGKLDATRLLRALRIAARKK